jgi:predicted transcriptional regulator
MSIDLGSSQLQLLKEAKDLIVRSRAWLAEEPPAEMTKGTSMTEATPQAAAQLYAKGMPVVEVAKELGVTYGKARKLISASGTTIRDASTRLKGRTRPVK